MKTFDIALNYLKWVDLSKADIFTAPPQEGGGISTATGEPMTEPVLPEWFQEVIRMKAAFDVDPENNVSNDYYRSVCFECALYHYLDLAHKRQSCWHVALGIVGRHNHGWLLSLFQKKWGNTEYPAVMMEEWEQYVSEQNPKPFYLNGDMTYDILMTAYHYVVDKKA